MNSPTKHGEPHSPPYKGGVDATSGKCREASAYGADGVVAHTPSSKNAFRNTACERPPRLRRFGGFATFYYWRSHPSFARRGMRSLQTLRKLMHKPATTCLALLLFLIPTHGQEAQRSVWDGIYNEEQAKRGQAVFLDACSNCHGRDLEGADMTPPLTGGTFMSNWDGLTVGDLVERIR